MGKWFQKARLFKSLSIGEFDKVAFVSMTPEAIIA